MIVPSLPGFGFSTQLTHAGVDVPTVAYLWNKLMTEVLGYGSYAAHGGDWGSLITAHLGHAYSENVIGVHLGLPVVPGLIRNEIPDHYWVPEEKELRDRADEAATSLKSHLAVHTYLPHTLHVRSSSTPSLRQPSIWIDLQRTTDQVQTLRSEVRP